MSQCGADDLVDCSQSGTAGRQHALHDNWSEPLCRVAAVIDELNKRKTSSLDAKKNYTSLNT